MTARVMSGLLNRATSYPLPLRSSTIFAEIKGFTSRTTAMLTYYNHHRTSIEGLFILPLSHNSALVEFECLIEGHYITANILHNQEIEGKEILFGKEQMQDGVFNICIGNIAPWVLVEIQVTLVSEISMTLNGDALHYKLPQTFSPKLVTEVDIKHAHKMSAESTLGYSFQIEILIEAPCLLCGVQSNTHPIQVDAPPLSRSGSKLRVSLPENYVPTDYAFELLMFLCRPREPYIFIEEPCEQNAERSNKNPISNIMSNPILMLSYSPDISVNQQEKLNSAPPIEQNGEFFFIVNCNTDNEILRNDFKDSWMLLIKSLPKNSYFNVFNLNRQPLFSCSQVYNENSHQAALQYLDADTNSLKSPSLLEAVKWIYSTEEIEHVPKQVLLITSGNLGKCQETLEVVRKKHYIARIFTFCTEEDDEIFSLQTLSSLTKARNYTFNEEENLQIKIIESLNTALQPAITDLKVSWILPDAYDVIYTPENLPPLYLQDRLNLFAILATKEEDERDLESGNSIKEFWFEDFDPIEELVFDNCLSRDLTLEKENDVLDKKCNIYKNSEQDNEVFLTEDEATKLQEHNCVQKKKSIERIQSWKISKHPDEIDHDILDPELKIYSDIEKHYLQYHGSDRFLKSKNNGDGSDSTSSTNSEMSNTSSHLFSFPGYPTRLSSCRSLETRSPHISKYCEDKISDGYMSESFTLNNKVKCRKITQALANKNANTHLLDYSNEDLVCRLLESEVTEKRSHLYEWVQLQEEMIQCTWPKTRQKKISNEWRDSGFGRHSSTDQRSSDLEDDLARKSVSISSSGYFENEELHYKVDECKINEKQMKSASSNLRRTSEIILKSDDETELLRENLQSKKNSKPKVIMTSLISKLRSFANTVSEKSKYKSSPSEGISSLPGTLKKRLLSRTSSSKSNQSDSKKDLEKNDLEQIIEDITTDIRKVESMPQTTKNKKRSCHSRNPPIIENSRTFSASSMFEISQSEIGDVNNLQLHPSQALIYLSGQLGKQSFKRIIPFQLLFNNVQNSSELNNTVMHQLAAKSIIKDLEMQLDLDEMLEIKSRSYIQSLIAEVSISSHIPSRYTILTLNDDKCNDKQITSIQVGETNENNRIEKATKKESIHISKQLKYDITKEINYTSNGIKLWQIMNPLTATTNRNRPAKKSYMNLIEIMQHDGSWELSSTFANIISVNFLHLQESCPFEDCKLNKKLLIQSETYENIWTTAIALSWLDMFWKTTYKYWMLINQKSKQWLMRQHLPNGFDLDDILLLSQQTLNLLNSRK